MSYTDKIARIVALVEEHNTSAESKIDSAAVISKLKALGATTEQALTLCTWEDLGECGLPKLLARQAANILRSGDSPERPQPDVRKKTKDLSYTELFAAYSLPTPGAAEDSSVSRRLAEISKGRRVVAVVEGKVDVAESVIQLLEILRGFPERESFVRGGKVYRLLKIGEALEADVADENPLYPGRPLRFGQVCDQTNRSWDGVSLEVRQILHIAVVTRLVKLDIMQAHALIDLALSSPDDVAVRFAPAKLRLDAMKAGNEEPKLKVRIAGAAAQVSNNPFIVKS